MPASIVATACRQLVCIAERQLVIIDAIICRQLNDPQCLAAYDKAYGMHAKFRVFLLDHQSPCMGRTVQIFPSPTLITLNLTRRSCFHRRHGWRACLALSNTAGAVTGSKPASFSRTRNQARAGTSIESRQHPCLHQRALLHIVRLVLLSRPSLALIPARHAHRKMFSPPASPSLFEHAHARAGGGGGLC
jgi:hypothetical protein